MRISDLTGSLFSNLLNDIGLGVTKTVWQYYRGSATDLQGAFDASLQDALKALENALKGAKSNRFSFIKNLLTSGHDRQLLTLAQTAMDRCDPPYDHRRRQRLAKALQDLAAHRLPSLEAQAWLRLGLCAAERRSLAVPAVADAEEAPLAMDAELAALLELPTPRGPLLVELVETAFRQRLGNSPNLAHLLSLEQIAQQQRGLQALQGQLQDLAHHCRSLRPGQVRPGDSYTLAGDPALKESIAAARRLTASTPTLQPALSLQTATFLVAAGALDEAVHACDEAREASLSVEAQALALFNRYRIELEQKRWSQALGTLEKAVQLVPSYHPFPFERYRPGAILGAGAFGVVFQAADVHLGREVVIKAFHEGIDLQGAQVEGSALATLDHPNIVKILHYDTAAAGNSPYLVMEAVAGQSLESYLANREPLSPPRVKHIALQIAGAMAYAHGRGLLHRDLKPANVLVDPEDDWRVRVIDFGLSAPVPPVQGAASASSQSSLHRQSLVGTWSYAPPEQRGELDAPVAAYSDIYAFGKLCAWLLCKQTQPTPQTFAAHATPEPLVALLFACMTPSPARRPAQFDEVMAQLQAMDLAEAPDRDSAESAMASNRHIVVLDPPDLAAELLSPVLLGYGEKEVIELEAPL
ncbi:MAG: protein kinase [Candidatus Competibacterales bacterium]